MRASLYRTVCLLAFGASLGATAILWRWADAVYRSDQWKGWMIGTSSMGVPVVVLSACLLWLGHERRVGHDNARVGWLLWTLGIMVFLWMAMFAFSLM
jgi:hypothetical protein